MLNSPLGVVEYVCPQLLAAQSRSADILRHSLVAGLQDLEATVCIDEQILNGREDDTPEERRNRIINAAVDSLDIDIGRAFISELEGGGFSG